jgi:membrane dipeptidase
MARRRPIGLRASAETLAFHRDALVFDCLSLDYILDEPYATRVLEAGVNATNLTITDESDSWDHVLRLIEVAVEKIEASPVLVQATCAADIVRAQKAGKVAVILGTQGASMIETFLWRVELLHRLGIRYLGLAYTGANLFADGCGETRDAGISFLGRDLIEAVNGLPMLLDLSHCGHRTRAEAAGLAKHPVCTHSNAYGVNPNDRNTTDETVVAMARKGGAIGVCGLTKSVWPKNATIDHMLDHLDHFVNLVGHRHVGIGLDMTEGYQEAFRKSGITHEVPKWRTLRPDIFGTPEEFFTINYPKGLDTIRLLPNFTQGLFDRGYGRDQAAAIMGGNWFRNFKSACG